MSNSKLPNYIDHMDEFEGHPVRHWNWHRVTWKNVADMTPYEAMYYLSHYANSDGGDWSARAQFAMACRIGIEAIRKSQRSDYEVIKEILDRSKLSAEGRIDYYNQHDWSIISLDGYEEVDLEFDSEGNIL